MRILALAALTAGMAGFAQLVAAQGPIAGNAAAAAAGQPKAVVELFTSQGCSSCPAADALFEQYADRDDVVALSMSVDYWDYLGWKDTLASPKFSERQRAYSETRRDGMMYTPQMVVNGLSHTNGADKGKIEQAIEKSLKGGPALKVPIRLSADNTKLTIEVGAAPQGVSVKDATLWLAVIAKKVEVPIRRGENTGRTITYNNVVRELTPIGMWSGKAMTVNLERDSFMRPDTERCAVLLQQGKAGPIVGANMMKQF
jgi:hypothetical protein